MNDRTSSTNEHYNQDFTLKANNVINSGCFGENYSKSNKHQSPALSSTKSELVQTSVQQQRNIDIQVEIECIDSDQKENRLYMQISGQSIKMLNTALTHNEEQEDMCINLLNNESTMIKVGKSNPDGNCLFSSLAHQLFYEPRDSLTHKKLTKKLRLDVTKFIRQNISLFKHEIKGRIYEVNDAENIENIEDEINLFVKFFLPKNAFWGGSETLKAVSMLHKVNIIVFFEDESYRVANEINWSYDNSIMIAYRNSVVKGKNDRDHYDSISQINQNEIYTSTKQLLDASVKANDLKTYALSNIIIDL